MPTSEALTRHGRRWVILSFIICPCHLPITLGILTTVLAGTAAGLWLHQHLLLSSLIVAVTWAFGTTRGLLLIRQADRFAHAVVATRSS
ncbi:hypothetical protein ACFFLM_11835 [Deinococcus oregonensis]|uniref:Mercury resistance protein n=1 Tax=Deinococcus oregonensis TaxID=1805970 RepID=A0ABV6AYV2_9DEIO